MSSSRSGRLTTVAGLALSAFLLGCSGGDDSADLATATTVDAGVSTTADTAQVQAATTEREAPPASVESVVPTTAAATTSAPSTTSPPSTTEAETTTSQAATSSTPTTTPTSEAVNDSAVPSTAAPTTTATAPTTAAPAPTAAPTTASTAAPTTSPTTAAPSTTAPPTTAPSSTTAPSTTSSSIATVRTPTSVVAGSTAAPTSAISLAAELTQAEQAIRNPAISDAEAAEWGRRQQRLYRELSRNSEWAPTVIELAAADVRNAVELNWGARSNLNSLGKNYPIQDTLPAWRIKEPAKASDLTGFYREGESNTGVSWTILAAINLVETRMGRIEGVSTAGAMGPMQFLPTTWNECCEGDPWDPHDAIIGAAHYLTVRGAPGNLDRAIFGYNNSNNYVTAVKNYAAVMAEDPLAYRGYHAWEVYYRSSAGLVRIPIGYEQLEKVDAAEWLEANPTSRISD